MCEDCCLSPLLSNDILSDRLDIKVMVKIRSWERFYYQISYEQDQVVVSGPNGCAGMEALALGSVLSISLPARCIRELCVSG